MTLTQRQRECLELIIRSYEKRGKPPLISELAEKMHIVRSSVDNQLRVLEHKGYIRRANATYGFIRLVKDLDGDPVTVEVNVTIRKVVPSGL